MVDLIRLSNDIATGAQVTFVDDVARNPSEGRISGRTAMRPVVREYMLSVSPAQSLEMQKIIMTLRGARYPLTLRDYFDNYVLDEEVLPHTSETVEIGRTWTPATGSFPTPYFERILFIDESETDFIVKVNGSVPSPAEYTFEDYGKINIPGLEDTDTVTVSGHYLMPVCIVDSPSATIISKSIQRFSDIRLEQIFEAELEQIVG